MEALTNKHKLPPILVAGLTAVASKYSRGDADYSVTQLLGLPQAAVLKDMHPEQTREDAADRLFSAGGQIVHQLLEQGHKALLAKGQGSALMVEKRLSMTQEVDGRRYTVSGQVDLYDPDTQTLYDWKYTSVYKMTGDGGVGKDWEEQVNLYALLLRKARGLPVKQAYICGVLRDHSKPQHARRRGYPAVGYVEAPVDLWYGDEQEQFLAERIRTHENAVDAECAEEDIWIARDGWPRRCQYYCSAAPVCDQWFAKKKELEG